MCWLTIAALIGIFLFTSIISVVTGSTSLITVPALVQFGVAAPVAIATNMFALTWMSIGGAIPFLSSPALDRRRLPWLLTLTLVGSAFGARLVLVVPAAALPAIIGGAMLVVLTFSLAHRPRRGATPQSLSRTATIAGYLATLILGVYGGFFSGGYVTLLTAAYVALFGMTFTEAVAITKVINIVSSGVATLIFVAQGIIEYRLGVILGVTMFLGALLGARITLRLPEVWLRRIFVAIVLSLALRLLLYDFLWGLLR